jgi:hypothetical protein
MIEIIVLILGGILAAFPKFAGKNQTADDLVKKIAPFQGWIGVALFVWGVWLVINFLLNLGIYLKMPIVTLTIYIVTIAVLVLLGGLLGFNVINEYVFSKNPKTAEKAQKIRTKLAPKQSLLGIIAIIVGVIYLVIDLIY